MFTRSSRRPRSSGTSGGGSAYYPLRPGATSNAGDAMAGAMPSLSTNSSTSPDAYRPRSERPSSAPAPTTTPTGQPNDELAHVEQRLKIIKRNRSSRHKAAAAAVIPIAGLMDGAVSYVPYQSSTDRPRRPEPQVPPCSAYPTFSRSRMPKHEQHVVEAMVGECLDVLFFPSAMTES